MFARQPLHQLRQQFLDAIDRLDDIGAGLLGDGQKDRRLFAIPGSESGVGDAIDDRCNVGQPQDGAVARLQYQRRIVLRLRHLPIDADRFGLSRSLEAASWLQDIGRP